MNGRGGRGDLAALIAARRPGYGLAREFFRDELVYAAELERIWRRGWIFVGHTCQLSEPGDFFTFELGEDPLLVVRADSREVHAFHNVCRHRGTLLCDLPAGNASRFVCPYHQWTFGRDGTLLACRGMSSDLDRGELGLHRAHVRELEGLIFVCVAHDPPDFTAAAVSMGPLVRPQGLERARIARAIDYEVAANWKLVWENNRECYHCNANHPQYIRANFDHYNADDTSPRVRARIAAATARSRARLEREGLAPTHTETGMATFPDAERDLWYAANRTLLAEGYVTESMDGKQVAPLMGVYDTAEVGTLRIRTMPNFWNHSSCDHSVSTRLLPAGPALTRVQVSWLVDARATEGVDYRLEELTPFWQLTSEQDWDLCARAQRGVNSTRYSPGPYSRFKEYNVEAFVRWYLKQLGIA